VNVCNKMQYSRIAIPLGLDY